MSSQRLRSDFWVGAYLRLCNSKGASAVLRQRGAAEAGAIFVVLDKLNGEQHLFGPAPQSLSDDGGERLFTHVMTGDALAISDKLTRELRFDSDMWIIDLEDREGNSRLQMAKE